MELLVLFPLAGLMLSWQRWHGSSTASAALHVVCAVILVLFAGGLLGVLPASRWLLLVLGVAALVFELARHRRASLASLGSVPMVVFLGLCVLYFLVHGSSTFRYYDEFSHWGIYLKDMVALGGFWQADSNTLHPRYPPATSLWQYFFVFSEIPREGTAYFAQFLLLLAPLLVLFEALKWRQAGWAAAIIVLILFGYGNFGHGIASLYIDHVISALVAGILLNFLAELRKRSTMSMLSYALPLATLALVKDSCFFFALALGALFFLILAVRDFYTNKLPLKKALRATGPALLLFLGAPVLVTGAWSIERNLAGAEREVMSVTGLAGIVTGKTKLDDPERAQVVRTLFPHVFLNQQLSKNSVSDYENAFTTDIMPKFTGRFRLTTASFLLLFVIWAALMVWKIVPPAERLTWSLGFAGLFGISVSYMLMLYLSYQFVFPRHDAVFLASYVRYIHSVTLPMLLAALAPLLPVFAAASGAPNESLKSGWAHRSPLIFGVALVALVAIERPHIETLIPGRAKNLTDFREYIRGTAAALRSIAGSDRLWLYMPDNDTHNYMSRVMLFELAPTPTTINRDFEYFQRPREQILAEWAGHDYVWIAYQDPEVDERLRELVGTDLGERLYKVTKTATGYDIELVRPDPARNE